MTLRSVLFFESARPLPGFFDSFLGGFFLMKGIPLIGQQALIIAFALALWLGWKGRWRRSAACSLLLFCLAWMFLVQPWDEVFINLRHAQHLAEQGRFSFNRNQLLEGSVDFLPYALVAALSKIGLPLPEGIFLLGLFSGLVCLGIGALILRRCVPAKALPFCIAALCLYPPLIFNSAHGFATAPFAAAILGSVYLLYFTPHNRMAWCLIALLPLFRPEAILLSWLFAGLRKNYKALAFVSLPFLVHSGFRLAVYGSVIPLPVQYKASLGSLFFFAVGMRNLVADAVATHALSAGLVLAIAGYKSSLWKQPLIAVGLFCIPYYLSGGDWFPSYWGRYLLPLSLLLWIAALCSLGNVLTKGTAPARLAIPAVFFLFSSLWPISSTWKFFDLVFSHRRTLAMIHEPTLARGHYRIQHLSQLGEHLRQTTLPTDRVGSSELATIMFYADREAVDFLGVSNPAIARAPLRDMPSLFRRFPYRSELPYLIFRRLKPEHLGETLPEVLYTFDFILRDQVPGVRAYELDDATLFKALERWETQLGGLMDPLYGGLPRILALGYSPIVVRAGEDFVSLYFVHASALERHQTALRAAGYQGALKRYTHPVAPSQATRVAR